ncbi:SDR family oxidoreductase [uncultured Sphingomonas sp.]|uniref:SDR family oxidoreductase n=1 Tax=uncultured Sphingomonas sp. TaxID=158754 RepID=UPI0025E3052A|nr:SDR family oxidoreductase [uncultured Sphingomonas sp.]
MPTVLITGANRGLGLEFVRQYQAEGWTVVAARRNPSEALSALSVREEALDMGDLEAVSGFADRLDSNLDLLVANAGIYGPPEVSSVEDGQAWLEVFGVNCIAPTLLARSVLPLVQQARGKMVAISSRMGSITDSSAGSIAYRSSKAALNMAWHVLALEAANSGVTIATLNPGWVQTDMGGASAPLAASESIRQMRAVIADLSPSGNGGFFDRTGEALPW